MGETAASADEIQAQIMMVKGKRTKRHRLTSPSSSTGDQYCSSSSVCVEAEEEEEDQDMANCLILLAQGREKFVAAEMESSLYLYQCKTCERCFPSFQALGGHRASHKKPKNNVNSAQQHHNNAIRLSLELSSTCRPPPPLGFGKPNKVHECSICGAEFSSGQALGGHMRRHRAVTTAANRRPSMTTTTTPPLREFMMKKERTLLDLDLNLPAPEDDRHRAAVTVFSAASPLVGCHY